MRFNNAGYGIEAAITFLNPLLVVVLHLGGEYAGELR